MIDIEKRKFLAELSKLLTFMFDEDRQTALSMYNEMFDNTDDKEALTHLLVSPTRQAVIIARAYNAKERDLAVRSKTGDGDADVDSSEMPRFVKAIGEIAEKAEALCAPVGYSAAWENSVRKEPEIVSEELEPKADQEEKLADPTEFAVTEFPDFRDEDEADVLKQKADGDEEIPLEQEPSTSEHALSEIDEDEEISAEEHSKRINEYMASFYDAGKENVQNPDVLKAAPLQEEIHTWRDKPIPEKKEESNSTASEESAGEINIPLLILYIVVAVPLTAIGVLLILIPAILCLAISLVLAVIGFQTITTAFGGFAVFADIMVVLGGALVVIAIALCAMWAFIWFVGGAIVGLINSAIRLGGNFCSAGGGK